MQRRMSDTVVLVVDMLNTYRHPDAEKSAPNVAEIIDPLATLVSKARGDLDVSTSTTTTATSRPTATT
jgi:nicotinamidase-related amidase